MPLLLVTGASGEVARGVLPLLEQEFDLRLVSLDPPGDDPRRFQVDILDWDNLAEAVNGVDAVLHLAVASGHSGTYENDAFNDARFDVNVRGTYHVFETARRCRVKRVVNVSSLMATWGQALLQLDKNGPVAGDARCFPVGTYGLTKTLAEEVARYYGLNLDVPAIVKTPAPSGRRRLCQCSHPMKVLTLRIAAPFDLGDARPKAIRPQQVPFPDLAQAFSRALKARLKDYQVVTIVGLSSRNLWDLEPARRVLGYKPQHNLDELGIPFAADPFDVAPV